MVAPIFSVRQVYTRYRLLLAVLITIVIQPTLAASPNLDVFSSDALLVMIQQIGIGVMMGTILQLAFNALIFGGQVMAYSMGLGFASMMDPANGVQVPVVSQYWQILAMLVFLMTNGHLTLIEGISESFAILPIAVDGLTSGGLWAIVTWSSTMFSAGLLMALPIIITLLLVNIGMGVIARSAPQLNIFAIGFPITLMVGFIVMWVTLPHVMSGFGSLVVESFAVSTDILRTK